MKKGYIYPESTRRLNRHLPGPAAGQLPARVFALVGQQDLLHTGAVLVGVSHCERVMSTWVRQAGRRNHFSDGYFLVFT
jgi:hypothetical protein